MRITRIAVYRKSLRYAGGAYAWGRGNVIETAGSTVVVIDTDAGPVRSRRILPLR